MTYAISDPIDNLVSEMIKTKKAKRAIAGPEGMTFYGNRYSVDLDRKSIRKEALWTSRHILKVMEHFGADSVAVTGQSGIIVASATLMLVDFPLMIVRKEGEETHGSGIEGRDEHNYRKYIILDDFVSSGDTVRNIETRITKRAYDRDQACELVGVLCYNSHDPLGSRVEVGEGKLYRKIPIVTRYSVNQFTKGNV